MSLPLQPSVHWCRARLEDIVAVAADQVSLPSPPPSVSLPSCAVDEVVFGVGVDRIVQVVAGGRMLTTTPLNQVFDVAPCGQVEGGKVVMMVSVPCAASSVTLSVASRTTKKSLRGRPACRLAGIAPRTSSQPRRSRVVESPPVTVSLPAPPSSDSCRRCLPAIIEAVAVPLRRRGGKLQILDIGAERIGRRRRPVVPHRHFREGVGLGEDLIDVVALAADHLVVAVAALQRIVALATVERVIAGRRSGVAAAVAVRMLLRSLPRIEVLADAKSFEFSMLARAPVMLRGSGAHLVRCLG